MKLFHVDPAETKIRKSVSDGRIESIFSKSLDMSSKGRVFSEAELPPLFPAQPVLGAA